MLGLDLAAWNTLMWLALGLAAFAAMAIFLTMRVVITLQDKEAADRADEFARYKVEVGEMTAGLEAEAAKAHLETERLKAQFAWRSLSKEQTDKFLAVLCGHRIPISVIASNSEPERVEYAAQFRAALHQVGLNGASVSFGLMTPSPPPGLSVAARNVADGEILIEALRAAGLEAINLGTQQNTFGSPTNLIIGPKPKPGP